MSECSSVVFPQSLECSADALRGHARRRLTGLTVPLRAGSRVASRAQPSERKATSAVLRSAVHRLPRSAHPGSWPWSPEGLRGTAATSCRHHPACAALSSPACGAQLTLRAPTGGVRRPRSRTLPALGVTRTSNCCSARAGGLFLGTNEVMYCCGRSCPCFVS